MRPTRLREIQVKEASGEEILHCADIGRGAVLKTVQERDEESVTVESGKIERKCAVKRVYCVNTHESIILRTLHDENE